MALSKRKSRDVRSLRHSGVTLSRAANYAQRPPQRRVATSVVAGLALLGLAGAGVWATTAGSLPNAPTITVQAAADSAPSKSPFVGMVMDTTSNAQIVEVPEATRAAVSPATAPLPTAPVQTDTASLVAAAVARATDADTNIPIAGLSACAETVMQMAAHTTLKFPVSATILLPDNMKRLRDFAAAVADCDSVKVTIGGHTDPSGIDSINLELSWIRARFVRDAIAAYGFDTARYQPVGFGSSQPLLAADGAVLADQSRRVDFIVAPIINQ